MCIISFPELFRLSDTEKPTDTSIRVEYRFPCAYKEKVIINPLCRCAKYFRFFFFFFGLPIGHVRKNTEMVEYQAFGH